MQGQEYYQVTKLEFLLRESPEIKRQTPEEFLEELDVAPVEFHWVPTARDGKGKVTKRRGARVRNEAKEQGHLEAYIEAVVRAARLVISNTSLCLILSDPASCHRTNVVSPNTN